MSETQRSFVPAAGKDWLLPLYDPFQRLFFPDSIVRALLDGAGIAPGHRVLEIGCGTGSVTVLAARRHPEARVIGLDPDPKALAVARRKAAREGVPVHFDRGFADRLPHPSASFDRVLSSLMFHHLSGEVKRGALREARRVLRPGGSLHLLDFGPPRGRLDSLLARLVHRGETLRDNLEGRIPELARESGFAECTEVGRWRTLFGALAGYRART